MKACGLKLWLNDFVHNNHYVTPYEGVWIEMLHNSYFNRQPRLSRLMKACGLKYCSLRIAILSHRHAL